MPKENKKVKNSVLIDLCYEDESGLGKFFMPGVDVKGKEIMKC